MRNLKLEIEFEGNRYKGWQNPKESALTVEYKLKEVFKKMTDEDIDLIGCGRMDIGVHAENFVANFHTNCTDSISSMLNYLYEYLPEDIVVKSIEEVDDRFHSRYNLKSKTYVYRINNSQFRSVFNRKFVYHTPQELNLTKMRKVAEVLVGPHDFRGFTTLKSNSKSTNKTIYDLIIRENNGLIEIEMTADDFLINMPLIIVGTLLEAGSGEITPSNVEEILNAEERPHACPIAKVKGLTLKNVQY